ncbi:MAG: cell surface protein [Ottowia sp.]|uniref:cell surface protein n=1 Tax=Ottowia sp. TaxID=1898956 RepID=UPI003C73CF43
MKKSLLALGAVAALGGLGFSGAANAVWVVGNVTDPAVTASELRAADSSGVGHILVTPYFSTTNNTGTLLSVVNTDTKNGKAVKVRFRGAANSDDILDFTVLMSPGDVWTASVSRGADGLSTMSTSDTSCVLPAIPTPAAPGPFTEARLDGRLTAEARAAHTQEGYIEWLNMADIPKGTPIYDAIKHANNVAPCAANQELLDDLMRASTFWSVAEAKTQGLVNPTGGLMGNWTIYNSANVTSYGGPSTAIVATDSAGNAGAGRLFFAPQIGTNDPTFPTDAALNWIGGGTHLQETADPLLASSGTAGILGMLPFDLPDLSTPYVSNSASAAQQADELSASLATTAVMNEWTAGASDGVDFSTDWVFSQPTRRYHAVVNYGTGTATPTIIHRTGSVYYTAAQMELQKNGDYGSMACLRSGQVDYGAFNREESTVKVSFGGGQWSPGAPAGAQPGFCGEVAVMQFGENRTRALNGVLTVNTIKDASLPGGGAGWMSAGLPGAAGLPVIGYAANTFNTATGNNVGNYGDAITHRYKRPAAPVAPTAAP